MAAHRGKSASRAAALTHVGLVRESNEDAVFVGAGGRLLVCADGLGGLPCGEIASRLAVEYLAKDLEPRIATLSHRRERAWRESLRRAFLGAHAAVIAAAKERKDQEGMATTLVAAVTTSRQAYVCHVGDVRAYLRRRGGLERLTDDHSVVFDAVRTGHLTVEQARVHPKRNFVTQAIGLVEGLAPATTVVPIAPGDTLLLCSDGLWETMPDEELARLLDGELDPSAIADALVERALAAGGPDNVSVVVYRHC